MVSEWFFCLHFFLHFIIISNKNKHLFCKRKKCNFYHLLASICGLTCFLLSSLDIPKSCERIRLEGSIIRNTKRSKRPIIQLSILVLKSHTKIHTQWHIQTHTHALYNTHTHSLSLTHTLIHIHSYTNT